MRGGGAQCPSLCPTAGISPGCSAVWVLQPRRGVSPSGSRKPSSSRGRAENRLRAVLFKYLFFFFPLFPLTYIKVFVRSPPPVLDWVSRWHWERASSSSSPWGWKEEGGGGWAGGATCSCTPWDRPPPAACSTRSTRGTGALQTPLGPTELTHGSQVPPDTAWVTAGWHSSDSAEGWWAQPGAAGAQGATGHRSQLQGWGLAVPCTAGVWARSSFPSPAEASNAV